MLTYPTWLNPVVFKIGPLTLRWYALAYIAGLLLGWRYALYLLDAKMLRGPPTPGAAAAETPRTPRQRELWGDQKLVTPMQLDDFIFYATLGVILGGRIGYILFYMLPSDSDRGRILTDFYKIWEGGMSFHGGLIGVIVALVTFALRNKAPLLGLSDLAATAAPIGLFFGRLANFVNAELYGRATSGPWAMRFPIRDAADGHIARFTHPVHPSQLYEATLEGLVLFTILGVATHRFHTLRRPGMTAGMFLLGYGVFRFLVEFVREPDKQMPDFLRHYITMGMLLCLPMIAIGAALIWWANRSTTTPAAQARTA